MSKVGCDTPDDGGGRTKVPSQLMAPRRRESWPAASTAATPPREWPSMATRSVGKGRAPRWGSSEAMAVALLSWSTTKDASTARMGRCDWKASVVWTVTLVL